ncbi:MAG: PaaI family thioesterase [Nitrospinota bacterium]
MARDPGKPGDWGKLGVQSLAKEELRALIGERWRGNFNELVGLEFIDGGEGFAKLRLPIRPQILQPWGTIHGGALATLLDVTGGVGAHLSYPRGTRLVTLEMKINYIAPLGEGALIAQSEMLHRGRRTTVWNVQAVDEAERRLRAIATMTYMVISDGAEGFPG